MAVDLRLAGFYPQYNRTTTSRLCLKLALPTKSLPIAATLQHHGKVS